MIEPGIGAGPRSPAAEERLGRPNDSVPVPRPDFEDHASVARWRRRINAAWGETGDPRVPHRTVEIGGVRCLEAGPADGWPVVYAHGGGYCLGSAAVATPITARLVAQQPLAQAPHTPATEAGRTVRVVSVDYRLAPEHPFPAALDDVVAVCEEVGRDGPYAAAGDSAGGGLVLAAAVNLRSRGEGPAALALLSPHLDHVGSRDALDDDTAALLAAYVGDADPADPRLSPLRAVLSGLPPTLIQVADGEAGRRDAATLSRRLRAAGVATDLDLWAGMWHTWHYHAIAEADLALAEARAFLSRAAL